MTFSILFDQINHAFPLVTSKFVFQDLSNLFNFKQIIQILITSYGHRLSFATFVYS